MIVFDFNQGIMLDRQRLKDYEGLIRKKINDDRMKELEKQHYMEYEEKMIKEQRQKIYKNILDEQLTPVMNKSPLIKKAYFEPNPCR